MTQSLRGAHFTDVDMSGAVFREVDLTGVRMHGVVLTGADIDGDIRGLTLNGVQVADLVEAEMDRQHPERTKLRPTTPHGVADACAVVAAMWQPTLEMAASLTEADRQRSVNDEWSLTETLRHLVFVVDSWLGHAVLQAPQPFHPLGLPSAFITDAETFGIDRAATPAYHEVLEVRQQRLDMVADFANSATQEDLDRVREPNPAPGWPPPAQRTAVACLQVIFSEEWAHHRFAVRDLAIITT
jgi:DinB superfamily/Pentapeptide repeats (8 copies)